jgi:hypothetical protein
MSNGAQAIPVAALYAQDVDCTYSEKQYVNSLLIITRHEPLRALILAAAFWPVTGKS